MEDILSGMMLTCLKNRLVFNRFVSFQVWGFDQCGSDHWTSKKKGTKRLLASRCRCVISYKDKPAIEITQ